MVRFPRWLTRVLVGTVAVPALFAGLVLWSFGERDSRAQQIPAAVVNLDEPVTQGQGEDAQVVYAGRLLAAELTSPAAEEDRSLGWVLADADDARTGLAEGRYYAVVTIPEDFSSTLAGIAGRNPAAAEISVRSNDAASPLVAQASDQIGAVASARLGQFVTANFLEGIFTETATFARRLGEASEAASQIADGVGRLGAGAREAGSGASELATGLGQLDDGAGRLADGAGDLADGVDQLASGAGELAAGARRLDGGADQLASGLGQLARQTRSLPQDAQRLADGAGQVADGVDVYADLVADWAQACRTRPVFALQAPRLCAISTAAAGEDGAQARALADGARQVAGGTQELADSAPELRQGIRQLADGSRQLADGTSELADGASALAGGGGRLAGGARELGQGASALAVGAGEAGSGARQLADGVNQLGDGSGQLDDGARQLADGLAEGADQVPAQDADEAGAVAEVVSQPVRSTSARVGDPVDLRTSLTPAALALGLWIGAFVTFLVRSALPRRLAAQAGPAYRVVRGGLRPALLLGALQAAFLVVAVVVLDGAPSGALGWLGLLAGLALGVVALTAVAQAFVAVSGPRRGWIALIVFTALQVVTLGGLVPIETAPAPLAALDGLLPVSALSRVLAPALVDGTPGSVVGGIAVLVLWAVAALLASTAAARRRQLVRTADLRRDAVPVG